MHIQRKLTILDLRNIYSKTVSTGTNEESGTSVEFRGLFDADRGRQIEFGEEKDKIDHKAHLKSYRPQ